LPPLELQRLEEALATLSKRVGLPLQKSDFVRAAINERVEKVLREKKHGNAAVD